MRFKKLPTSNSLLVKKGNAIFKNLKEQMIRSVKITYNATKNLFISVFIFIQSFDMMPPSNQATMLRKIVRKRYIDVSKS